VPNNGIFHGKLKDSLNYEYVVDRNVTLKELSLEDISSQKSKLVPSFIIAWKNMKAAISFWVSAKRTRSYPYTRMFNTLSQKNLKKITIFPVIKDEGMGVEKHRGCFDPIQWDTFSMCSYLGIYTISAYYVKAKKNPLRKNRVRSQEFDHAYLVEKIKNILTTNQNPKQWNDVERNSIGKLEELIINGYQKISKETGVEFRNPNYVRDVLAKLKDPESFKLTSQEKSEQAQNRENLTTQPKEMVFGLPKGKMTLEDSLGGKYYWTVDAYHIESKNVYLMEMKHAKKGIPSISDIKDALFKFHFYANLSELRDENDTELTPKPTLVLSSGTESSDKIKNDKHVKLVIEEAEKNNIIVIASGKNNTKEKLIEELVSN